MDPMNIVNELDYIDLEDRRGVQSAAQQWHTATHARRRNMRKNHIIFIAKVYSIAIGLVAGVVIKWLLITTNKFAMKLVRKYNFLIFGLIFLNFIMMTILQHILRCERPKTKLTIVVYIFLLVEIGSVTLARPIAQSTVLHLIYAFALTLGIVGVSFCIAISYHLEIEQEAVFLAMWAIKCFLTTSICLQMTLSFDNLHVQISIALLLIFFVSIFIIVWGRSLGSFVFYREESSYLSFYISLAYLTFFSLFVNSLVFFEKIKSVNS